MNTRRPLFLFLLLALPVSVVAQTTETERAAARDIIAQIDALQARLNPTAAATRLAGRGDATRDGLVARTRELWE